MPSLNHEALLQLFRRRPTLAIELLRDALGLPMPALDNVQIGDSSVSEILPTERKADLVLLLTSSPGGAPEQAIIVEVQLAIDPDKRRSWWWYLVGIHTRHQCDAVLVVVTPSASVAAWAAKPIALGHPGASLVPIVIGPDVVPVVRDPAVANLSPELAVLSAMMHGNSDAAEDIASAAFAAVRDLDDERARLYTDVIFISLHAAARAILEDLMANGTYEYQSDFAKRYMAQGRTEGVAQGRAEGEAHGRADGVLRVLTARGIDVPPVVRERVLACTDIATLDAWLVRAVTANAASDVIID
jgi:hypothetical protein